MKNTERFRPHPAELPIQQEALVESPGDSDGISVEPETKAQIEKKKKLLKTDSEKTYSKRRADPATGREWIKHER